MPGADLRLGTLSVAYKKGLFIEDAALVDPTGRPLVTLDDLLGELGRIAGIPGALGDELLHERVQLPRSVEHPPVHPFAATAGAGLGAGARLAGKHARQEEGSGLQKLPILGPKFAHSRGNKNNIFIYFILKSVLAHEIIKSS